MSNDDGIPDLPTQLAIFAGTVPVAGVGDRPLAALWFGANDVFDALDAALPVAAVEAVARAAAQAVALGAVALAASAHAVQDFVIPNIPDLGRIPAYALFEPANAAAATAGATAFNTQIDLEIDALRGLGLNVIEVAIADLFDDLLADPAAFGLTDVTLPCVIPDVSICSPAEAVERAFFDLVHPNAGLHARIAEIVGASVAPVPLPLPAALLASGVLLLALRRRRA